MGEIDDTYKSECEIIDQNFLEELRVSKDHDKSFRKYRENLKKCREKFSRDYEKFNSLEKKRLAKMKKKLPKNEKFKRLVVEHFDFEFSFWERLCMKLDVGWFTFIRVVNRFFYGILPGWVVYRFCKTWDFSKNTWKDFIRYVDLKILRTKTFFVKLGIFIWENLKRLFLWIKIFLGKLLFWVKKEKVEGEKKEEKKDNLEEEKAEV